MLKIKSTDTSFKNVLTHFGLLLFPFILPLPLPLNIKSIGLIIFFITLTFNIFQKDISIKMIWSNKVVLLFILLYILDPILAFIRGDGFYIRDLRISFLFAPSLFLLNKNLLGRFENKILNIYVLGVFCYLAFIVVFVIYFFSESSKVFSINYYLKYVTYRYLPFAIHHTYMGVYICFAASIIMFEKNIKNSIKVFLCLLLFLSTFIIGSKFSIVLFMLIICAFLIKTYKESFLKIVLFITAFIAGLTFILSFLFLKTDLFRTLQNSLSNRIGLIHCSLEGIFSNFLIGIGNKNIKNFIEQCNTNLGPLDTHNLFLQEFLSNGILGITTLTIILYIFAKTFFNRKSILGIILIILLILFGLIEHVLNLQYGLLFFIFFLLLFYSRANLNSKSYTNDG